MRNTLRYLLLLLTIIYLCSCRDKSKIDRFALVTRHNIENSLIDSLNSLSVGNGEFAFYCGYYRITDFSGVLL